MRRKALILLVVGATSLIPYAPVQAESGPGVTVAEAAALMYFSDAILTPESELDSAPDGPGGASPSPEFQGEVDTDPLLARIIHAKKMERNDLDANCALLVAQFKAQGDDCSADQVQSYCTQKRSEINSQIGFYHKLRGDQRKVFTRIWHSIKRNASNFWHRIGPFGRSFLRRVGDEALQIVASGGSLSGATLKNLIKHQAKAMGRERIKQIVYQGVQKLLQGQLEIAQAAGVDICGEQDEEGEAQAEAEAQDQAEEQATAGGLELPTSGTWNLTCQHTWGDVIADYPDLVWQVEIDWGSRSFAAYIQATSTEVDGNETIHWDWHEESSGTVTDDGFLWGDAVQATTLSVQYGDAKPTITEYAYEGPWIGAIAEDLSRMCFYRVGAQDWFTLEWIRERGRNEMLEPGSGLCEADCPVN